jgi:hypothetical protein
MRNRLGHVRVLLVGVVLLCGCARYQEVWIRSNPEAAEIYLDGILVGLTPMQMRVGRDGPHKIFLKRPGYRSELIILELQAAPDQIDFLTPPDVNAQLAPGRDDPSRDRNVEIEIAP